MLAFTRSIAILQDIIKRKAEIIDLIMKGFGNRLANPKSNLYQVNNNEESILHQKGVQSADVFTHSSAKPISASSSSQQTVYSDYIKVEADDELY